VSTYTERGSKAVDDINHWCGKPDTVHTSLQIAFKSTTTSKKANEFVARIEKSVKQMEDWKLRTEEMVDQAKLLLDLGQMNVKATTKTNPNPQVEDLFNKMNDTLRCRYHAVKQSLVTASAKVAGMLAPSQQWNDWKESALAKLTPLSPRMPASKNKRAVSPAPSKGPESRTGRDNQKSRN
jgi:hypothetical protein